MTAPQLGAPTLAIPQIHKLAIYGGTLSVQWTINIQFSGIIVGQQLLECQEFFKFIHIIYTQEVDRFSINQDFSL